MAIPSGSGTEVLKRTTIEAQEDTATAFRWDGTMADTGTSTYTVPAHHIITVISVIFTEQDNETSHTFQMVANNGSDNIALLDVQSIGAKETFIFSDKFILTAGDKLMVNMLTANGNIDVWCSYIDQDWS